MANLDYITHLHLENWKYSLKHLLNTKTNNRKKKKKKDTLKPTSETIFHSNIYLNMHKIIFCLQRKVICFLTAYKHLTVYKHLIQFPHFTSKDYETKSIKVLFCNDLSPNSRITNFIVTLMRYSTMTVKNRSFDSLFNQKNAGSMSQY